MAKTKSEVLECKTTIIKSLDHTSVFEFTNEYGFNGKKALVITLASESDNTPSSYDRTKYFTFINMTRIGYSKITVYNLFPRVNEKLEPSSYSDEEIAESLKYLRKLLAQNYDAIVVAFGTKMSKNKRVRECKKLLFEILLPYHKEGKVMRIIDNMELYKQDDDQCLHPLFAGNYMGGKWKLIPYDIENVLNVIENQLNSTNNVDEAEKERYGSEGE